MKAKTIKKILFITLISLVTSSVQAQKVSKYTFASYENDLSYQGCKSKYTIVHVGEVKLYISDTDETRYWEDEERAADKIAENFENYMQNKFPTYNNWNCFMAKSGPWYDSYEEAMEGRNDWIAFEKRLGFKVYTYDLGTPKRE